MNKLMAAAVLAVTMCAAPPDPVVWKLNEAPAKPVKPGARFSLKLVAKIQEGWHLYSLKPLAEGPIPTRIWLPDGQPFQLAAAIQASEPQTLQDPSFNMEVELYEGEATFTLPVRIVAGAPFGSQTLVANASYQSCNNKICLPPKTVKVEIPIAVSK
ncbi:MAG TPA: protein-disulfide reductase DsbD N-terminal domain-containing protein [Bryobacteraceae bacterium]|jgi:DsbC/DsbD-like thiol-disulfide interchange protein|nr:protein-disulfide reductase DsbD N-terminal domain-containing protein [Bryobacteraceae bacterium]